MKPEKRARLERWLTRNRPRAAAMRLQALHVDKDATIRMWSGEEMAEVTAEVLLDVAQDYVDEESASADCSIECLDPEGNVIISRKFVVTPVGEDGRPLTSAQLNAHKGANLDQVLVHFMQHDTAKTRIVVAFLGTALSGMQELIKMNQSQLAKLDERNARLEATIERVLMRGLSEEEQAEQEEELATGAAIGKLKELLPMVLEHVGPAIAEKLNGTGGGAAGEGTAQ